jgi:hypothetical protein
MRARSSSTARRARSASARLVWAARARWARSRDPMLSTAITKAVKTMVALAGPVRSGAGGQPQPPRDEGQRPHPPQFRPPLADSGEAEHPKHGEYLPPAPRPASPPGGRDQRGQQQRQPPDPPGQHRIPGRQRQRRHHRHGQQQLPRLRDTGDQVDDAQRERRHPERGVCRPALPVNTIAARATGRGRSAPGPARATPAWPRRVPPPGRCGLPGGCQASVSRSKGRPPGPHRSSRQR